MTALVELRILEGPNLYFPRAAIVLSLDVRGVAPDVIAGRSPIRDLARLVRDLAHASGTARIAVRVRPTADPYRFTVIYPWRERARAEALARAVVQVLDQAGTAARETLVARAAERVAATEPGPGPSAVRPRIPVVAVTGTRGSRATSAVLAHLATSAGHLVGWANDEGIHVDGELTEPGEFSGPEGPRRLLDYDTVDFAVTEVSRGGILLKGIGLLSNTVSVVTDVGTEHLGDEIDTLDVLAEVKGVVAHITRKEGWAVLQADDPRVLGIREATRARPWVFTLVPGSPAAREVLTAGGRVTTVLEASIMVVSSGSRAEALIGLADVPPAYWQTDEALRWLLAATTAALAAGLEPDDVVKGLASLPTEGLGS